MQSPQLWVWIGSSEDRLDLVRYVKATKNDLLSQSIVREALERLEHAEKTLKALLEELERIGWLCKARELPAHYEKLCKEVEAKS